MIENAVDLDLSGALVLEGGGQRLMVTGQFLRELERAHLNVTDIKQITECVCRTLKLMGWLIPQPGLCLAVTETSKDGFLFGYASVTPFDCLNLTVTGSILIFLYQFEQEVAKMKAVCAHLEKKQRRKLLNHMLRGSIGVTLAHELVHAWGINRNWGRHKNLPVERLELVTDAIALVSCIELFRSDAYLGAPYIQQGLKARGEEVTCETAMVLARSIIAAVPITDSPR